MDGVTLNDHQKGLLELEHMIRVCHQGGLVVDLCCGSGSGCIAGLRMGYSVAGFDISGTQVKGARRRISEFQRLEVSTPRCLLDQHCYSFLCITASSNQPFCL